jgi:hypothetical protein
MQKVVINQRPFRPAHLQARRKPTCVVRAGLFDFLGRGGVVKGGRSTELVEELLTSTGLSLAPSSTAQREIKDLVYTQSCLHTALPCCFEKVA